MELRNERLDSYSASMGIRFIYRVFDIVIGLLGSLIAIFLCVIVKIAYLKNGDKESIIFTQERIGLNGKLFKMYKIRSMVLNADQILFDLMEKDENIRNEYEKNKKLENDPRITQIGKKIRKTSLDEFPQFFNVLLGQMTLVGPRPYLPREKKDMGGAYNTIIQCKPAITGPWQIGGRSDITFDDRCQIDVEYIKDKNIKEDIEIFIRTITQVLKKEGAK